MAGLEELLDIAAEIAEMGEGPFVLQVKLHPMYLAIDAGGIGEVRNVAREHQRCGLQTVGVFDQEHCGLFNMLFHRTFGFF